MSRDFTCTCKSYFLYGESLFVLNERNIWCPGLAFYLTPPASSSAGDSLSSSWLSGLGPGLSRDLPPSTAQLTRSVIVDIQLWQWRYDLLLRFSFFTQSARLIQLLAIYKFSLIIEEKQLENDIEIFHGKTAKIINFTWNISTSFSILSCQ